MDVDSSERCVVPVEAVLFLLFGEQFEGLSACLFVEIGEIVDLQWDGSTCLATSCRGFENPLRANLVLSASCL